MKQKLLIVEDDTISAEIISIGLRKQGYDLTIVTNGKTAYDTALQQPPDLILMDITMPEWDGFETCRVIKSDKLLANIPVIFITGSTNDIDNAFSAGGADYIVKPIRQSELHTRIGFHLQRNKLVKEITQLNIAAQKTIQHQTAELALTNRKLAEALHEIQKLKGL